MGRYVLGIDAGTESIRAVVFDASGQSIGFGVAENHTEHPSPGWAEQPVERWKTALVDAVRKALHDYAISPSEIVGIGVDGTSCTVVCLDEADHPLMNAIMWMDIRAAAEAGVISGSGHEALKAVGYGNVSAQWFPCKALWLKRHLPDLFRRTRTIFEQTDWLIFEMTGEKTVNVNTTAIRWFYDHQRGGFPRSFYQAIDLADVEGKIPGRTVQLGEVVSSVSERFARLTGLRPGTPVAAGGADAYMGIIGVNALRPGEIALITGSSHLQLGLVDREIHGPGIFGTFNGAILPGVPVVEAGQVSTGSVVKWFVSGFANASIEKRARSEGGIYAVLDAEAARISPGSDGLIVLEHWQGNRTPWVDPFSRGVIRGLTLRHTPFHVYRAILEGVAYGTGVIIDRLEAGGVAFDKIFACGGAVKSDLWMQIHADVLGKPILIPRETQAVGLGSAILAAVGSGWYRSLGEAADGMVQIDRRIEPDPAPYELYRFMKDRYARTYECLKEEFRELLQVPQGPAGRRLS